MKLTKQLLSKIVLGIVVLALVAGFAVAYAGPSVASAQTATTTPTPSTTPHTKGTGTKTGTGAKHFKKFKGHEFRVATKAVFDAAAKTLTITTDELKADLKAGQSISDVATAKSINIQTVKDAMLAAVKSELATRVTAGKITQTQADARYKKVSDNIDKVVNAKFTGHKTHTKPAK